jgi:hypothetical protein
LVLALGRPALVAYSAEAPADNAAQEGVEPQGRGPVHEAFAEPVTARPQPTPIIAKQPPDPIDEMPPDQKPEGDNVQWISGYWAFDEDSADFLWVSGLWRAIPPGRQWVPGHWAQVQGGWQWTPGYWTEVNQQEAPLLPPPPNNIDAGPSTPAPSVDSVYVSGTWVYRTDRFYWRPGFWYTSRPGWVWVPARYVWTPGGYIFVEGYWDYPLQTRGLLFAPVVIERRFWGRPHWVFRPRFIVYDTALVGALFVRPDYGCYYFGDYFEPEYRRRGFVAWVDFRVGRTSLDPLFSYYRWRYRGDREWERNLRGLYVNRYNGGAARPPRTIVQQNTVIKNITVNKNVNITNIKNVTVLAPITKVDKTVVKLKPVSRTEMAQHEKAAVQMREAVKQRQKITAELVTRGPAPTRPTDKPRVAKVALPKLTTPTKLSVTVKPPTPPSLPQTTVRTLPKTDPIKPPPVHKPEVRPMPTPKPVVKPDPKPVAKPGPEPKTEAKPKPVTKPEVKPVPKPMPKTDPKPPAKPEAKPMPKTDPKPTTVKPPVTTVRRAPVPTPAQPPRPTTRNVSLAAAAPAKRPQEIAHPAKPAAARTK